MFTKEVRGITKPDGLRWDSDNIWVGNGNLKQEFAKELVDMAKDPIHKLNRFVTGMVDGRPTFRFRLVHEDGKVVIFQQTPMGQDEHTVAKYNEVGQRITDGAELWDFPNSKPMGEKIEHDV